MEPPVPIGGPFMYPFPLKLPFFDNHYFFLQFLLSQLFLVQFGFLPATPLSTLHPSSSRVADPFHFDADPDPRIRIKNMDQAPDPDPDPTM